MIRLAIALIGYNRPAYFQQVVNSLDTQFAPPVTDYHVFLDGGIKARQTELEEIVKRSPALANATVWKREKTLGCGRNIIDAREQLFDREGYDRVIVLEDDLVLGPHYLRLVNRLADWAAEHFTNVAAVRCWNACPEDRPWKEAHLAQVASGALPWWGYAMDRSAWERIGPHLAAYRDRFLMGRPYAYRRHRGIRTYHQQLVANAKPAAGDRPWPYELDWERYFANENLCTGQDVATMAATAVEGMCMLFTVVNRGLYIGVNGIHSTPENFERLGYDRVTLDVFERDGSLEEFEVCDAKPVDGWAEIRHSAYPS